MVIHFTKNDWQNTVNLGGADPKPAIVITFEEPVADDIVIQVYEKTNENEYHLVTHGLNLNVVTKLNNLVIACDTPFIGKVVYREEK